MSETQTIKLLKNTVCGGRPVMKGDIVEASLKDARFLINRGRAEAAEAPKKRGRPKADKNKQVEPDELETK